MNQRDFEQEHKQQCCFPRVPSVVSKKQACDTIHVYQHSDTSIDSIPVIGTTDKKQGCGVIGTKNTNPKGVETCSIWMKHLLHTSQP